MLAANANANNITFLVVKYHKLLLIQPLISNNNKNFVYKFYKIPTLLATKIKYTIIYAKNCIVKISHYLDALPINKFSVRHTKSIKYHKYFHLPSIQKSNNEIYA